MKVTISYNELRDFIREIVLYGKFYDDEVRLHPPGKRLHGLYKDHLFSFALSNNNAVLTLSVDFLFIVGNNDVEFTTKIDLPKEKCSVYKKYAEIAKQDEFQLDVNDDITKLITILMMLSLIKEFREESSERRNEFIEMCETWFSSYEYMRFIEYLLKHATSDKSKSKDNDYRVLFIRQIIADTYYDEWWSVMKKLIVGEDDDEDEW